MIDKRKAEKINDILSIVLAVYMVISIILMKNIKTEFNTVFYFSFTYLTIPFYFLVSFFSLIYKDVFISVRGGVKNLYVAIICIPPLLALGGGGYVAYLNTIIPPQIEIKYAGKIIKKLTLGRKNNTYAIDLSMDYPKGQIRRLVVSQQEYYRLNVGGHYERMLIKGGLGITYNP